MIEMAKETMTDEISPRPRQSNSIYGECYSDRNVCLQCEMCQKSFELLPYRQSLVHNNEIRRHPAERETDGDVDHGLHDIDLRFGQTLWSVLIPDLATFSRPSNRRFFRSSFISLDCIL